jgi:hypothetical protein
MDDYSLNSNTYKDNSRLHSTKKKKKNCSSFKDTSKLKGNNSDIASTSKGMNVIIK